MTRGDVVDDERRKRKDRPKTHKGKPFCVNIGIAVLVDHLCRRYGSS